MAKCQSGFLSFCLISFPYLSKWTRPISPLAKSEWFFSLVGSLITMPTRYINIYGWRKKRSLIARHLDRYLTIRCHGNSVTLFTLEDSRLLYLFLRKIKAPLDTNEATQFTSTARTVFPAHFKQRNTTNLQEKQTQIQLNSLKSAYEGFSIGIKTWHTCFIASPSYLYFLCYALVWFCFLFRCLILLGRLSDPEYWLILTGLRWTNFSELQTQDHSFAVDCGCLGDFGNDMCLGTDRYFLKRGEGGGLYGQSSGAWNSPLGWTGFFLVNSSLSKNLYNTANRTWVVEIICLVDCLFFSWSWLPLQELFFL